MSDRWARAALQAYRWIGMAAYPFMGPYVAVRASRGKEQHSRRGERYGKASVARPPGPLVWIHAVSVGETGAIIALAQRLRSCDINVVLTTGTVTSAALASERLGANVIHQYVPLDVKPAVSRFLNHWKPDLAIFAESEVWPMTILELGARRIPQVLVNGRMSDRSFKRWSNRLALAESLFENFSFVAAQTDKDAERFRNLGARPVSMTGNLKVDVPVPPVDPKLEAEMSQTVAGRPAWAAISTHEGEEIMAARIHRALKKRHPGLLTIIVPRHPERAPDLYKQMREMGLTVTLRSGEKLPHSGTDIFLGDTIGEMGLYLRMAGIAFVGKSLASGGGQNPLEPAMLDTAILSGPNVSAFEDMYARFTDARAVRIVDDETMLAKSVHHLLENPRLRDAMARSAARVVGDMEGALDRTWQVLMPYVQPLIVGARLGPGQTDEGDREDQPQGNGRIRIGWQ